ncbi:ArnT family glycosyltransferase [Sphingomonas sp.]|uniref:ArnT family glycosyltransferase n=1 Tax=Sphingomonas sp. TaxID=28214 RepID=UPI003B3B2E64
MERSPLTSLFLLSMLLALVTRVWQFGNPVIQVDEQLYLLIGDRMLHGAVPFVDIWDRKPLGIFLLYAAIRMLGGVGIIQYQIVATIFAGLTAFLIGVMALRMASWRGAVIAATAYLIWLIVFDGSGGQTPVFYNLPVAGAGLLVLEGTRAGASRGKFLAFAALAMFAMGVALQIKYSAVFEGIFFGVFLLWRARERFGLFPALAWGVVWIAVALLPTAATFAWYVAAGYADAFIYTNFISIFQRGAWPAGTLIGRVLTFVKLASPLAICAIIEWRSRRELAAIDAEEAHARRFAFGWLMSAVLGLLLFGTYFIHYFLPVLVPLSLYCARILGRPDSHIAIRSAHFEQRVSIAVVILLVGIALAAGTSLKRLKHRGKAEPITQFAHVITRNLDGCLLVFDGEPILYQLTGACIPTKLAFPNHLNDDIEKGSLGLDPTEETRRIFRDVPPDMVVTTDRPDPGYNVATRAIAEKVLARDYHLVGEQKIGSRVRLAYKRNATAGAVAAGSAS